jgi:hypothetical protein
MRFLCACLALAACATLVRTPAEQVGGCWINRSGGPQTIRWARDEARPGVMRGAVQTPTAAESLELSPAADHWRLCETRAGDGAHCWDVAQGERGSLDGGRAFIDVIGGELRIAIVGDGPERLIFQGRRQRCQ